MDRDYESIGTNFDYFLETKEKVSISFDELVRTGGNECPDVSLAEFHGVSNGVTVDSSEDCGNASSVYWVSNNEGYDRRLPYDVNVCTSKHRRRPQYSAILYEVNRYNICKINGVLYYYNPAMYRYMHLNLEMHEALVMEVLMRLMGQDFSEDTLRKVLKLSLIGWRQAPDFSRTATLDTWVRLKNGIINFKTGSFVSNVNDVVIHNLRCQYLNGERTMCPVFDSFVKCIAAGDLELEERIWQVVGYILAPDPGARVAVIFQGVSGGGKSVLVDLLKSFFYDEDIAEISLFELKKRSELKNFVGRQLVVDSELPNQNLTPAVLANLKKIITGDSVKAEHPDFPHKIFDLKWQGKLLLASNYRFRGSDNSLDDSLCRRFVVIPFRFKPEKIDRHLLEKLVNEKNAIFVKAAKAARELEANNYHFLGSYALNEAVLDETVETYIFDFLRKYCLVDPTQKTATRVLYKAFCDRYGDVDCTENLFSRNVEQCCKRLGYKVSKERLPPVSGENYVRGFLGICLKPQHLEAE